MIEKPKKRGISKLPAHMEEHEIADLLDGEIAYTLPWAIQVAIDGDMWIRGDYPVEDEHERHPNAVLKITRRGRTILVEKQSFLNCGHKFRHGDVRHAIEHWRAMPIVLVDRL